MGDRTLGRRPTAGKRSLAPPWPTWQTATPRREPSLADYATAMLAVVLAAWFLRPTGLTPAAWWITAGAAVAVAAGLIQWARVAPHARFNHNDLFHVVQMASLYLLYRGGVLLRDMQ